MIDVKDLIIADLKRTMAKLERELRSAGSIDFQPYHSARDQQLAVEFLKMAEEAKESLTFVTTLENNL